MKKQKKENNSFLDELASKDIHVEHGQIELVEESRTEKEKHRLRRRLALVVFPILLLAVTSWLIAGVYMQKVRVGTSLLSARQSDSSLQALIKQQTANYRLTVAYPDGSKKTFSMDDMGLFADPQKTMAELRHRQQQFSSRLTWWHPQVAYLALNTDNGKLNAFIAQKTSTTIQPAKDATISLEQGKVVVTDSVAGKHYGLLNPLITLESAASTLQSQTLSLQVLSTRPAITSKQLVSSQTKLQQILNQPVELTIDNKKIKATPADIAEWIELTPKSSGHAVDVGVNSGKVLAYINKVSAASIHPPKAEIKLIRADGTSDVLVAGVNGTDVVNKSAAAADIAQNLLQGKAIQKTLEIKFSPYKTVATQNYDKWIEVDTTNKRMYAYEQGSLIQTFLISAGAPATPTVVGQFAIYAKYIQQDMSGLNVDGSSYFQPKVPWVNYFYGGYAIHGNYWRPLSYFGNINSSHGCVGVTVGDGEWIYSWAPLGTPVIVHS